MLPPAWRTERRGGGRAVIAPVSEGFPTGERGGPVDAPRKQWVPWAGVGEPGADPELEVTVLEAHLRTTPAQQMSRSVTGRDIKRTQAADVSTGIDAVMAAR